MSEPRVVERVTGTIPRFFIYNHLAWESADKIETMKTIKLLSVCFLATLLCISCKKDDGADDALSLSTNELHFAKMASSKIVTIVSTDVWMTESPANWITLSSEAGKGKTDLLISVKENTSNTSRESYIKFSSSNESKLILVTQSATTAPIDNSEVVIDAASIVGCWKYGNQYITILEKKDDGYGRNVVCKGALASLSNNVLTGNEINWNLEGNSLYLNDTLTLMISEVTDNNLIVTVNGKTREYVKDSPDEFIKSHIVGRWKCGTLYEKYVSTGTGYTWDTADDVDESEAQSFTWELDGETLTQYHQMEASSAVVPKQYTITTLAETTLSYIVNGKTYIFTKQQ
ncbi:MAG: BACON domain-containing protein [Bacteroidales bacterium]|nr:BACON domain-containing protein [Bacteroidales bacterium]